MKSQVVRSKGIETTRKRWGVENVFQSSVVKDRMRATCLRHYDVEHSMQSPVVRERARRTFVERYGVEHPWMLPEFHDAANTPTAARKRHATKKANGTYARQSSKAEDALYAALCVVFGVDAVHRHVEVDGKCIDMYVVPLDLYVALDGVYYHGLDRPLDVIAEHGTVTDVTIHGTYDRDRRQDAWFEANRMRLLRVTDLDDPVVVAAMLSDGLDITAT